MENNIEIGTFTIAVTELIKSLGISKKLSPIIAIIVASLMSVAQRFVKGSFDSSDIYISIFQGVLIGLTSTGLYRASKSIIRPKVEEFHEETY